MPDETRAPVKWSTIAADPEVQRLNSADYDALRQDYFERTIAPQLSTDEIADVLADFNSRTARGVTGNIAAGVRRSGIMGSPQPAEAPVDATGQFDASPPIPSPPSFPTGENGPPPAGEFDAAPTPPAVTPQGRASSVAPSFGTPSTTVAPELQDQRDQQRIQILQNEAKNPADEPAVARELAQHSYSDQIRAQTPNPERSAIEGMIGQANKDAAAIAPDLTGPIDKSTWDKRADGSTKGTGFLGLLKRPDGKVSSELSIGVNIGGKDMEIPSLVPTLTADEINTLLTLGPNDRMPESIVQKAVEHAKSRIAAGKSVFADNSESALVADTVEVSGGKSYAAMTPEEKAAFDAAEPADQPLDENDMLRQAARDAKPVQSPVHSPDALDLLDNKVTVADRGAPVSDQAFATIKRRYEAASPQEREAMASGDAAENRVARKIHESYGHLTSQVEQMPALSIIDQRREARQAHYASHGADTQTAENMAGEDFLAGRKTLPAATAQRSDFDFDTAREYKPDGSVGQMAKRGAYQGVKQLKQQTLGLHQMFADMVGADEYSKVMGRGHKEAQRELETIGQGKTAFERNFEGAIASTISNGPGMVLAVGTGTEAGPLVMMAMQVTGDEYANGIEGGLSKPAALARAAIQGTFEYIGEKLSLGATTQALKEGIRRAVDNVKKAPLDATRETLGTLFLKSLGKENVGEQLTTAGQFWADAIPGVGLKPDAKFDDYVTAVADTLVQTTLQTFLMAGSTTGVGAATGFMRGNQGESEALANARAESAKEKAMDAWHQAFNPPGKREPGGAPAEAAKAPEGMRATDEAVQAPEGMSTKGEAAPLDTDQVADAGKMAAEKKGSEADTVAEYQRQQLGIENPTGTGALGPQAGSDIKAIKKPASAQEVATPAAESTDSTDIKKPADNGLGFKAAFDTLKDGTFTNKLYEGLFESLQKGKDTYAGVKDPVLAKAKAAFDRGEIKSADDLRAFVEGKPSALPGAEDLLSIDEQAPRETVDAAAHEAATSPQNDLKQPSMAQKEAGNYQKGHDTISDMPVSFENPVGSQRSNLDVDALEAAARDGYGTVNGAILEGALRLAKEGKYADAIAKLKSSKFSVAQGLAQGVWSNTMKSHYGHHVGENTDGNDGDKVDVFVKEGTPKDYQGPVFVIDQKKKDGTFDEHKSMIGWPTEEAAKAGYMENYSKGWDGIKSIGAFPSVDAYKQWLATGDKTKPSAEFTQKTATTAPINGASSQEGVAQAAAASPVVKTYPSVEGTEIHVIKNDAGYTVSMMDTDIGKYLPTLRMFKGEDALAKATAYAESIQKKAEPDPMEHWIDAANTRFANDNIKFRADTNMGGKKFLTATYDGATIPHIHGTNYTQAGIEGAMDWIERNIKRDSDQKKATPERRTDTATRKRVAEMSSAEKDAELLTSARTGLPNERALSEAPEKARKASVDLDALKWVNDNMGHEAGDAMLAKMGEVFREAGGEVYHVSGDEFVAQADSEADLQALMERADKLARKATFTVELPDGSEISKHGIGFSYGTGQTRAEAEGALQRHKTAREQAGERPARGAKPAGVVENAAQRQQVQENNLTPAGKIAEALRSAATAIEAATNPEFAESILAGEDNGITEQSPETANRGSRLEARNAGRADRGPVGDGLAEADQGTGSERDLAGAAEGPAGAGVGSPVEREGGGSEQPSGEPRNNAAVRDLAGPARVTPGNFSIEDADAIGTGGLKTKYRENIAAIRLLKTLEEEKRQASPEEQSTLARYVGWGGIKGVFDASNKDWAKEHAELKSLLTEDEFARARRSILDAHYTSVPIIKAIHSALGRFGFNGGRVLEPSVGVGHFFGLMPKGVRNKSHLFGVELDPITGRIAQQLYPKAKIIAPMGFQDIEVPNGYFDIAIGNPPFGSQNLHDTNHPDISKFSIHNFFFAKSLEKLREGGILAMVVSRYFMDAQDATARKWIAARANLIGAVRLPYTAFKENANTEVVTDIIFLQKKGEGVQAGQDFTGTSDFGVGDGKATVNEYFAGNPRNVLGKFAFTGSMYRENELTVEPTPGQSLPKQLEAFVESLPEGIYAPPVKRIDVLTDVNGIVPEDVKVDGYFVADGKLMRRQPDLMGSKRFEELARQDGLEVERVKGMIKVRDALRRLMRAEMTDSSDGALATRRKLLNESYDAFKRKHGYINGMMNRRAFQMDPDLPLLESLEPKFDPGVSKAVAQKNNLEPKAPSSEKAAIFTRRVLSPVMAITHADNPKDALVASLGEKGSVDLQYMTDISGVDADTLTRELAGLIFEDPSDGWVTTDAYLTGNVKAKLQQARDAAKRDPRFKVNVEALEKVQPADVPPLDISVRLGSPWVPPTDVDAFATSLGLRGRSAYVPAVGRWSFQTMGDSRSVANTVTYGTTRMDAGEILNAVLNLKQIVIKDNHGTSREPVMVVNVPETQAAQAKAETIQQKFKDWIWQDADRRDRLAKVYNDTYNTDRRRSFDGSHLRLPGTNPTVKLRPHQKDVIWRILQDRTVLLDHVVGAGKTFAMAGAFMEMRRMGIARKPMLTVPNHLVRQWRDEIYALYPNANVLAATEKDFDKVNRQRLFARIATGDWDMVLVPHSSLKKIGMPPETEKQIVGELLSDLTAAIQELKNNRGDRNVMKDMERMKERLTEKTKKLQSKTGSKDKVVTFDELGVDALGVDEAHMFKNLFFFSQMQGVAGMGNPAGSGRAFDLFVKMRYLQQMQGEKAATVFATGTPVSNSLVEMYTMQRYMQYADLRNRGVHLLDAWSRVFGDVQQVYEVHPSGNGYRLATRFAKFVNLPELMTGYRQFADVITMRDLQAQAAKRGEVWPVPKHKGGKPTLYVAPRSEQQTRFFGVPEFARDEAGNIKFQRGEADGEAMSREQWLTEHRMGGEQLETAWPKDKGAFAIIESGTRPSAFFETEAEATAELNRQRAAPSMSYNEGSILWKFENLKDLIKKSDGKINALSITNEARKAGLDFRLIDPAAGDDPNSKLNHAADQVKRIYDEWHKDKGAQLIFCDLSIPSAARAKVKALAEQQQQKEDEDTFTLDQADKEPAADAPEANEEEAAVSVDQLLALQAKHSVYDDMRDKLIARGIPAGEIAFIHSYDTADKKGKLFALVRAGHIRVLMGSTEKMGAGMNVQERLVGIHHLDAPWRPSDLEQRNGRGFRQGNKLYERDPKGFALEEWRYATRQTYDTRMWQIIEHKANGVEQLRSADVGQRTIDDISSEAATAADMKAAASGNPLILDEIKLRTQVAKLGAEEYGYMKSLHALQNRERSLSTFEDRAKAARANLKLWTDIRDKNPPFEKEEFKITVMGKPYADKAKFAEPVVHELKAIIKAEDGHFHEVGKYRGIAFGFKRDVLADNFQLGVSRNGTDWLPMGYYGKGDEFKPSGLPTRIDNMLGRLDDDGKAIDANMEKDRKDLADVRAELKKPFDKKAELDKARREHAAVAQKLQSQGGAVEMTPAMKDELNAALKARGLPPVMRRGESTGMPISEAQAHVDAITVKWHNAPLGGIKVVDTVADLPKKWSDWVASQGATGDLQGLYVPESKTVYLLASQHANVSQLEFTLLHETLGHAGLRGVLGTEFKPAMRQVFLKNANVRAAAKKMMANYGYDQVTATEEALADMAGRGMEHGLLRQILNAIQTALRKIGMHNVADFLEGLSDAEASHLLADAKRFVTDGPHAYTRGMQPAMSRTGQRELSENSGNTYTRNAQRALDALDRVLDPLGTLPSRETYLKRRYRTLGVIAKGDEVAKEIRTMFFTASEADKKASYEYLTTAEATPDAIQAPGVKAQAVKVKSLINSVGDALVKRGLLSEESREQYRDAYLPRLYLKHLFNEKDFAAMGAGKKPSSMGYLKQRKDIPEEVRAVILGEVKEPGFLSAVAIAKPLRDMAILDWLESISKNEDWILPKSVIDYNGQRVSPYWLKEEADRLRRQAEYYEPADATKARDMAKDMDEKADAALEGMPPDRKQYRQMPNTARFGRLRGMWVREEIYNDLQGVNDALPTDPGFMQSIFGYGGIGTKITQLWKMGKVALNPPAQIRNFVSNAVLLQLSGVPMPMVPVRVTQAMREIANDGKHWKIAKKYGVTESTFSSQELFRMKRELIDLENQLGKLGPLGKIHRMGAIVMEKASDLYQWSEALFKTAKIIDAMSKGMNEGDAALEAQKWLFDYSLVHKSVRYARNAPIGTPFITFQTKVLPRLIEVAALHPQRFLPYVALMYGMAYGLAAALGVDKDDLDKLKKALPEWIRNKGHAMLLPYKDEQGRWQVIDLGYFFPWTYWTELGDNLVHGRIKEAVQGAGLFSGPVPSILTAIMTGRDSFTGREIMNKADPPERQLLSVLNYMWSLSMPPIITEQGVVGHSIQAYTGETNKYGDPRSSATQAALRAVGVNIYPLQPEQTRAAQLMLMKREIGDTKQRLVQLLQDRSLSTEQRDRLKNSYRKEIGKRLGDLRDYERESEINPRLMAK